MNDRSYSQTLTFKVAEDNKTFAPFEDLHCNRRPFIEISGDDLTLSPFDAKPIEGYEPDSNFPECRIFHISAIANAKDWFDKFPKCCKNHEEDVRKWNLKKSDYEGLPQKIVNNLYYTEYHISKRIDIPEWYEDITNYIDYIWWSFGHPNIGLHKYSEYLIHYLKNTKSKIPKYKKERLIEYIEDYRKPANPASTFDLNVIYDTFQKWFNTFPFDLPYFVGLKVQFEGKIPAFKEPARFNPYTGLAKAKGLTQAELIDALDATTKRLIGEVQTDKFEISDLNKHRLELSNESLRVETANLVRSYSKGELRYLTTLRKWLELQKKYFKEVTEIVGNVQKAEPTKPLKTRPTFAGLFENDEAMGKALMAARNCGLINEMGRWSFSGAKTFAASSFWKAVVTSGLGKADIAKASVSKAIGEHFGIGLGKNAIGMDRGEFDQRLYTNLLAAMKST